MVEHRYFPMDGDLIITWYFYCHSLALEPIRSRTTRQSSATCCSAPLDCQIAFV